MAEVVLVHGIGQEQRDPDVLTADWVAALQSGLAESQMSEVAERLARGDLVVGTVVNWSLRQATGYLTDPQLRTDTLETVADLLGEDTRVVIGHSSGSVP